MNSKKSGVKELHSDEHVVSKNKSSNAPLDEMNCSEDSCTKLCILVPINRGGKSIYTTYTTSGKKRASVWTLQQRASLLFSSCKTFEPLSMQYVWPCQAHFRRTTPRCPVDVTLGDALLGSIELKRSAVTGGFLKCEEGSMGGGSP